MGWVEQWDTQTECRAHPGAGETNARRVEPNVWRGGDALRGVSSGWRKA
jgi:hypothetical protein